MQTVNSRSPRFITLDELQRVMEWKLIRGKDRPMLRGLVTRNSKDSVEKNSRLALQHLENGDWKEAIVAMTVLVGVGPATASATLAPFDGELCPFMADEVLEATTSRKREYTLKAYESMRNALRKKAIELNKGEKLLRQINFDAEFVGKCLWSAAMVSVYDIKVEKMAPPVEHFSSSSARKRTAREDVDRSISKRPKSKELCL